jgi:ABC-type multidrug transport system ATPase subunit
VKISLINAGKKYYRDWIFRGANLTFLQGQKAVILGPNGSGKSTLLQVIAGAISPNEGNIIFSSETITIASDEMYKQISFASPYLELLEEFTLKEIVQFHFKFKKARNVTSVDQIIEYTGLQDKAGKIFKYFSSGMKQKVKLCLAFLSDTPVLLLDEPCSNLDTKGIEWYKMMIERFSHDRTVIVASNHNEFEYDFCDTKIDMSVFKK